MVRAMLSDPHVRVVEQSRSGFEGAIARYERRPDKSYSVTDCISMNVMESAGIHDVLTNDHHFAQEGFNVLIR
jgi:predicted nucleic acid-binding protein